MQQIFTHEFMQENKGCYSDEQLQQCSFMKLPEITLESILSSEIKLKDKYWFVCKKLATKEENQKIAIRVAEIVLPKFKKRYPNDNRPRKSIKAIKQYISGHISLKELIEAKNAAYAAADDAADDAADAAANAAAYAAAAYAAADDAAYAAAAYAAYAAYATADAKIKQQLLDYLKLFCLNSEIISI